MGLVTFSDVMVEGISSDISSGVSDVIVPGVRDAIIAELVTFQ